MKTTVIYHSADFDGIFCREIARKFLPDAELIGWNFGDPPLELKGVQPTDRIIVMDLPLDTPFGLKMHPKAGKNEATGFPDTLVWIDHDASSIASHPTNIPGYRIDGVAACRLAWQWFQSDHAEVARRNDKELYSVKALPTKQEFVDRTVREPFAVRLAGEYDIWDKRDPDAELFQHGLRSRELPPWMWSRLLETPCYEEFDLVPDLLQSGKAVQYAQNQQDESICNHLTWVMEWEGLKFLCVNHARFNSLLFAAKDKPETGHDALLGFKFDGKQWMVSLYHAAHRTDLDLCAIAQKHGGGGHRGACGFVCQTLPFSLLTG